MCCPCNKFEQVWGYLSTLFKQGTAVIKEMSRAHKAASVWRKSGKIPRAVGVLLMPTVPSSGPGTASGPSSLPRPRAGHTGGFVQLIWRAVTIQRENLLLCPSQSCQDLLPGARGELLTHTGADLCFPDSWLPRSSPRRNENPHRPSLHLHFSSYLHSA